MADPEQRYAQPGAFFGVAQAAAREGLTAAQFQQRVSAEADRLGLRTSFETRTELGQLYSTGVGLRAARESLAAADPSAPITHDYIAPLPYQRTDPAALLVTMYDARVGYQSTRLGQTTTEYITLRYTGGLPPTVGQLYADAQVAASSSAQEYDAEAGEVDEIEIGEW